MNEIEALMMTNHDIAVRHTMKVIRDAAQGIQEGLAELRQQAKAEREAFAPDRNAELVAIPSPFEAPSAFLHFKELSIAVQSIMAVEVRAVPTTDLVALIYLDGCSRRFELKNDEAVALLKAIGRPK